MEKFFGEFWHNLTNWGVGTILSIIISLIIIVISLPFTYIGYSIKRAVEYRINKFEGYAIRKYTIHAIVSTVILLAIEIVLFYILTISKFYSISLIFLGMVVLGLMGIKLTFSIEEGIDGWIEGFFSKE